MYAAKSIKRVWLLVALATVVVALAAACGSDTTPTTPPTATPTATPTPSPDPFLSLSTDALWADLIALLEGDVVSCLRQELGDSAFDALQANPLFDDTVTLDANFPFECIAQEAVISLAIASLSHSAGGLSGTTVECIRQSFGGIDFENLTGLAGGEVDTSGIAGLAGGLIGLLVCLDDDEAERVTLGSVFGVDNDLSFKDLKCVVQEADITQLLGVFGSTSGGPPDQGSSLELLAAFSTCGVSLMELLSIFNEETASDSATDADGSTSNGILGPIVLPDPSTLTAEQQAAIVCLQQAFGEETFAQLLAGTYTPQFTDLAKLGTCDIDLASLGELMGS